MLEPTRLRHAYPEKALYIDRKNGHQNYTFLHFFDSVKIMYNGKLVKTKPHAVIIYDIGTPQFFNNDSPIVHDWIHFKGEIKPILKNAKLELDKIYYPSQTDFITAITRETETEFYSELHNSDRLCDIKIEELFIKLGRIVNSEDTTVVDKETKNKFRYLRGKIFSSLDEKWSVERMSKEVGFSQSRFYNIYKAIYGVSPTNDLIKARTNKAENLLMSTNQKVEDIATLCGYDNTTHFIRQFKGQTGFSPSNYRKNRE